MSFWRDPVSFLTNWLQGLLSNLGLNAGMVEFLSFLIGAFIMATGAMLLTLILIWAERKIIGRFQDRFGPNRVGPWGIFQTAADMLKIFTKEVITPTGVDLVPYNLAPVLSVAAVLMVWAVIPFTTTFYGVDLNVGLLFFVAVGGLGEIGVLFAGWGSNNKFALLAAFRAIAQLISYEVPMVLSLLLPVMFAGSLSLVDIIHAQEIWFIFLAPIAAIIFLISQIAEVGRAPFDLIEADSELVSGFNIEYSGLKFGMFYVAEFLHAFTISLIFATLFLGGWRGPGAEQFPMLGFLYYMIKTSVVYFATLTLRASLPRFRIDQMVDLNWKGLTPLALIIVLVTAVVDKLLPTGQPIIRVIGLVGMNIVVFMAFDFVMRRSRAARVRPVVAPNPRPVARPDVILPQSDTGA